MTVVWSDEAVYALIALEIRLAERYSAAKAAEVVDALVRCVDRLLAAPKAPTDEKLSPLVR